MPVQCAKACAIIIFDLGDAFLRVLLEVDDEAVRMTAFLDAFSASLWRGFRITVQTVPSEVQRAQYVTV